MAKKINHIKPSFIEGGEVWHDIEVPDARPYNSSRVAGKRL